MDVTNKTWDDILLSLANSGNIGATIAIAIIAFLLGVGLVWVYYSKFRYYSLINDLASAQKERDQYKKATKNYVKKPRKYEMPKLQNFKLNVTITRVNMSN